MEELLVVAESVRRRWRQIVEVDHIVVASEVDVVDLVRDDDDRDGDKVLRVDGLVAVLHEEGRDEETQRGQVHEEAEGFVEHALLARTKLLILLL